MLEVLLQPFDYQYMSKAILACTIVGATCAFLSAYLILKGWSLIGDGIAHSVLPGVAFAYLLNLPFIAGAFLAGVLATGSMLLVKKETKLPEDAVIGIIFTFFFAVGLLIVSANPISIDLQTLILGSILTINWPDLIQILLISLSSLIVLSLKWKDLIIIFFDQAHAHVIGLPVFFLKILFFALLSAASVSALQTVGAPLVVAMLITPGATAYLLTNQFSQLILISVLLGGSVSGFGAYISYHLNLNPSGVIVVMQTVLFLIVLFFAPRYGILKQKILHE